MRGRCDLCVKCMAPLSAWVPSSGFLGLVTAMVLASSYVELWCPLLGLVMRRSLIANELSPEMGEPGRL